MVESTLIIMTYLLFYGIVGLAIILLSIICWLLHKQ